MTNTNNIPSGWYKIPIGDCIVERRKSPIKVDDATNFGSYPFFTSGDTVLKHVTNLVGDENIYLATGGTANVKYYNGDAAYSTDTYVVCGNDKCNTQFLYYALLLLKDYINTNFFQGSGLKHLQKRDFKRHELIIPQSVEEQKRIADALSKMDDAIAQSDSMIEKYELIKTGLMQDLLTFGIDEKGNIRSEETHKFKDSPIGRIPEDWECKRIKEIFGVIKTGITPSRSVNAYFESGKYPWVKTLDLNEGEIYDTDEKITDFCLNNTSLKLLPVNSVLVAMYGGWIQIGRTSINKIEACTNQAVCALNSPKVPIEPYYVLYYLQHNKLRWRKNAISTRKDPNISKKDVEEFYIAYPKSVSEQRLIVETIQKSIGFRVKNESLKNSMGNQQEGIMYDLITGKVRI